MQQASFLVWALLLLSLVRHAGAEPRMVLQRAPCDSVSSMAFSPDGSRFAVASGEELQVRNTTTGTMEWNLASHSRLEAVAWSPDGLQLACGGLSNATGTWRGTVEVWDLKAGQPLAQWQTGEATVGAVAWSPDGNTLATAAGGDFEGRGQAAAARLWQVDGKLLHTLEEYDATQARIVFSPDSARVGLCYADEAKTVTRIYHVATGKPLAPLTPAWHGAPAFAPDGGLSGDTDALASSPDGAFQLTAEFKSARNSDSTRLQLLPYSNSPNAVATMTVPEHVACAALSPGAQWLLTAGSTLAGGVTAPAWRLWKTDLAGRRWVQESQVERSTFPIHVAIAGEVMALATVDGTIAICNLRRGAFGAVVPTLPSPGALALSRDGHHLAAFWLWDLIGPTPRRGMRLGPSSAVAFSPDSANLIDDAGFVNVKSGRGKPMIVPGREDDRKLTGLRCASFSADGKLAVTVDETMSSSQAHLWRGDSGRYLRQIDNSQSQRWTDYTLAAFAASGDTVAVAGYDATPSAVAPERKHGSAALLRDQDTSFIGLFSAATGRLLRRFVSKEAGRYTIQGLQFSADGKTLMTSGVVDKRLQPKANPGPRGDSEVRTLRLWDVATGTQRLSLPVIENSYPLPFAFIANNICAVVKPPEVQFWNLSESTLIATLTLLNTQGTVATSQVEWIVQTPDGAFDASSGSGPFLRWRVDGSLTEHAPDNVKPEPGLLSRALSGGKRF